MPHGAGGFLSLEYNQNLTKGRLVREEGVFSYPEKLLLPAGVGDQNRMRHDPGGHGGTPDDGGSLLYRPGSWQNLMQRVDAGAVPDLLLSGSGGLPSGTSPGL